MPETRPNGLAYGLVGCGLLLGLGICGGTLALAGLGGAWTYHRTGPGPTAPPPLPPDVPVAEPTPAPEVSPAPKPRPVEKAPTAAEPEPAPATEATPEATPEPAAGTGGAPVTVDGPARVTLVGGGRSYTLPAVVPEGRYTIRAAFEGEQPVEVGNARISAQGGEVIACNPNMGICRVR